MLLSERRIQVHDIRVISVLAREAKLAIFEALQDALLAVNSQIVQPRNALCSAAGRRCLVGCLVGPDVRQQICTSLLQGSEEVVAHL